MERKSSIEGLRVVGLILVLLNHFMVTFYPAHYWTDMPFHVGHNIEIIIGTSPIGFIVNGNTGVMIFLVITGAGAYLLSKSDKEHIVSSALARPIKIFIPMTLSVFLIWLIVKGHLYYWDEMSNITKSIWNDDFTSHFNLRALFLTDSDFFSIYSKYNNPLWTMRYFFIGFYIALFICIISPVGKKRHVAFFTIVLLLLMKESLFYIPVMLGVIIAEETEIKPIKVNTTISILLLLVGIYFGGFPTNMKSNYWVYRMLPFNDQSVYIFHILGATILLILALNSSLFEQILSSQTFQFIGRYSMPIYYIHFAVIISFSSYVFLKLNIESYNIKTIVTILLSFFVIYFVAIAFNHINNIIVKFLSKRLQNFL